MKKIKKRKIDFGDVYEQRELKADKVIILTFLSTLITKLNLLVFEINYKS